MDKLSLIKSRRSEDWRAELRKSISAKDRMSIPRVSMPEEDALLRAKSLVVEVNTGLSEEHALSEAKRCLDCANPGCIDGCPVGIHIPTFLKYVEKGEYLKAADIIRESSSLPAVCGRVCPQEKQCESQCIYTLSLKKPAVAIGNMERFVADYERANRKIDENAEHINENGIKIAVVGSGPAGLSFASSMRKYGYDITVYEALHEIGGVLKYGIPEFRLPNSIVDEEIAKMKAIGVKFETNTIIGKTLSYEDLHDMGVKGIFVATGAGLPKFMNVKGENLIGVMSANEYLTRINLMYAGREGSDTPVLLGKNVAIIGGGNTAMDAVRTAKRMGADRAMIIYRRSEEEMPARLEEIKHAKEEGVEFLCLHNPIEYIGDEKGKVKKMRLQRMALGEPDASGRRRPIEIEGDIIDVDVDEVIVSIGVSPNPLIPNSIPELKVSKWGTIEVDENNKSNMSDIFAGGDIVRGGATVILAMGDGRKAAEAMHNEFQENK